jgi:glycosyltransferase involved in cell wall biosynthesis
LEIRTFDPQVAQPVLHGSAEMRVSVIIPTYNSANWVTEAVASALGQTYPAAEIIVVDDGSTDDTSSRIAEFGSKLRYIRKENGGVSSARNRGIEEVTGDWIAFLDADDIWHPRKLEFQAAALKARPKLGMLGTFFFSWPGTIPEVSSTWVEDFEEIGLDDLIVRNLLGTSTIIVRTDLIRASGPFDITLRGPEDHDMWIRVARLTQVAKIRMKLAGYRHVPGSLSSNVAQMEACMSRIIKKLEVEGVFRGRPWFRRKAWGFYWYSCGITRMRAGDPGTAFVQTLRSLINYPWLLDHGSVKTRFARFRILAATARARLGLARSNRLSVEAKSQVPAGSQIEQG